MSQATVRTAVIPVAGLGTRFLPVTKAVPKEMLPIGDRPCIELVVAEAVAAGLTRIVFVSARGKDALVDYFDRNPALEKHLEATGKPELAETIREVASQAQIVTVRQSEALGLGHAVLTAAPAVGDEPFAVLLGDDIVDAERPAIGQLIAARAETTCEAVVALMEVPRAETKRYGVCAGEWESVGRMRVRAMVEKPEPANAPSNHAIVGRYVLPNRIFEILRHTPRGRGGEIQLTDAIAVLAAEGAVLGQVFEGQRFDTGDLLGLLRASIHFTRKRPDMRAAVDAMLAEFR
jgi:UTP--glucose-1-phosphate uridylyltransferase